MFVMQSAVGVSLLCYCCWICVHYFVYELLCVCNCVCWCVCVRVFESLFEWTCCCVIRCFVMSVYVHWCFLNSVAASELISTSVYLSNKCRPIMVNMFIYSCICNLYLFVCAPLHKSKHLQVKNLSSAETSVSTLY